MWFLMICVIAITLYVIFKASRKGKFTDERDGQTYRTVKIGGMVWMAQNLNYKIDNSWCYNNKEANGEEYGRLYTWEAAKAACPNGWSLPSREEWDALGRAVVGQNNQNHDNTGNPGWYGAGKKLKARRDWDRDGNGSDSYGFSALPGGLSYKSNIDTSLTNSLFERFGSDGYWWTNAEGYIVAMSYCNIGMYEYHGEENKVVSVRCVKDK